MTQLDGIGFFESMKDQEESTIKATRKETILREMAVHTGTGLAELKIDSSTQTRREIRTGRGTQTPHETRTDNGTQTLQTFDMARDDEITHEHEEQLAEELKIKKTTKTINERQIERDCA